MKPTLSFAGGAVAAAACFALPELSRSHGPGQRGAQDVVRARAFEVVDEDGHLAAKVSSNANGGVLQLFRPGEEGEPTAFAFIGCHWRGGAEIVLSDPDGESKARLFLSVDGEPKSPSVSAYGTNGTPRFKLGSLTDEQPVITVWDLAGQTRFVK